MQPISECVAGFGHVYSVWFQFHDDQLISYAVETPNGVELCHPGTWLYDHTLVIKTTGKHPPKSDGVLGYLTHVAGTRAIRALADCNVYELALAFTASHSWQLINGAKILPDYGELAKVYAGVYAVYVFNSKLSRDTALKQLSGG